MGGTKRKLPMEKIEKKSSRAVCFSKRRSGLYSKVYELCVLSNAQMAILNTPLSSESNVSFYSFGHSTVDGVVDAFLKDQRPLGFWWEDERLAKLENAEELSSTIDSISRMLRDLKDDDIVKKKKKEIKKMNLVDQTLNLQSENLVVLDDKVLAISDQPTRDLDDGYNNNNNQEELDLDQRNS